MEYANKYRRCAHCGQPLPKRTKPRSETPLRRYQQQRDNARARGIAFKLTFDQWWSIWTKSKRWSRRGKRLGQYVMGRNGDVGAYEVGNVRIMSVSKNGYKKKP